MTEPESREPPVEPLRADLAADLDVLAERYREPLLRRIRLMMGPRARRSAESGDFLQQVFATALDHLDHLRELDEGARLRWLSKAARNRIHQAVRSKRERALASLSLSMSGLAQDASPSASPLGQLERRGHLDLLIEALDELKPEYRQIIEARNFEERSFAAIGAAMGRSGNAAQLMHTRAMVKLANLVRRRSS